MNIYSLIGLVLALVVLYVGFLLSSDNVMVFWDVPSVFIVVGGTIAAASIAMPMNRLAILTKVFLVRLLKGKKYHYAQLISELMNLTETYRKGGKLEDLINQSTDPFLTEALQVVADKVLEGEELFEVLTQRVDNLFYSQMDEANKIKGLGKYPPAFGMMGTTIGMIVLLGNLGGDDAIKKMGPAMAVCLITTLYGVIISNLLIVPAAENLVDSSKEIYLKNKIIIEGIRLLVQKTNPVMVAEKLNSYLNPDQRLDWKQVVKK